MRDIWYGGTEVLPTTPQYALTFERLTTARAILGESPFWDEARGCIWWVDTEGQRLLCTVAATGATDEWKTPEKPGFVVQTSLGKPAVGMETGVYALTPSNGEFDLLIPLTRPGSRFNDAVVDPYGRLWASIMALDGTPGAGALFRITADHRLKPVMAELTYPNGLAVDALRRRLYVSDSHPSSQMVWIIDCDPRSGATGDKSEFTSTRYVDGRPDGAALDRDGNYWIAGVDGSAIYVFEPDGVLAGMHTVPFRCPTKPAFLGPDGGRVVVTSKAGNENAGWIAAGTLMQHQAKGVVLPVWRMGDI